MDAPQVDVDEAIDAMPKVLRAPFRKFIKEMMAKAGKPRDDKGADEADEEREALADLHEEHKGKPTPIEALKSDFPPELSEDGDEVADEPDDDADVKAEKSAKKKGK